MTIKIVSYTKDHEVAWDNFCNGAINGTILHTRRFLGYHRDRFADRSLLVFDSSHLVGIFPAAESLNDHECIVSHPGITYGGLVHQGWLSGMKMIESLTLISRFYGMYGYRRLIYKPVPFIYTSIPAQDDLYALFRLGGTRIRCDLSSTIDLEHRRPPSLRRRRNLTKAKKAVTLSNDPKLLKDLWDVVFQNLALKHSTKPVHSLNELAYLRDCFPQQIVIYSALIDGLVEAGVVFFNSTTTWHSQYIAASEKGYEVSALDAVFDAAILAAKAEKARYFDFGTSNEHEGQVLNDGLYRFKSEFGGGGITYEHYELVL